jgi:hypothetical protein
VEDIFLVALCNSVAYFCTTYFQGKRERKKERKKNNREGESKPAFVYWKEGGLKSVGRPILYYRCIIGACS